MSRRPIDPTTGRRAAGRPRTIDRASIGDAALQELDTLSLANVARRLGVAKSALYYHVDGRADIAMMAADRALATWEPPATDLPLPDFLLAFAHSVQTCLDDHPGLDVVLLELHDVPPEMAKVLLWASGVIADHGIAPAVGATAAHMVSSLAHEDARHRRALGPGRWPDDWLPERIGIVARGVVEG